MDFEEALNELIDAITDVEEHGDAIETYRIMRLKEVAKLTVNGKISI